MPPCAAATWHALHRLNMRPKITGPNVGRPRHLPIWSPLTTHVGQWWRSGCIQSCLHRTRTPARMKRMFLLTSAMMLVACSVSAEERLDAIEREVQELKRRVAALEADNGKLKQQIEVDRLIVRKELIVSDTGRAWEQGFEAQQLPRGIYARSLWDGPGGLWVRSRLIKGEIDDHLTTAFTPSKGTGACAARQGIFHGTSGSMARGGRWRSSKARDLSLPKSPSKSGRGETIPAGSAFKPIDRSMTSH